jgi:hypothetical protein
MDTRHQYAYNHLSRKIFGQISWDPSVSKSNLLHVVSFQFFLINLRYILHIPLKK